MRVQARSESAAVRRVLEQLIAASGHELALADNAELVVSDQLHPAAAQPSSACITVSVPGGAAVQALSLPVSVGQLLRALRAAQPAQTLAMAEGWVLDLTERRALYGDAAQCIGFTEKECDLLVALLAARPSGLPREQLLARVWGVREDVDTHTLETHVYRLRQKLEAQHPRAADIVTEQGAYRILLD